MLLKYYLKASVKIWHLEGGNQTTPWSGVHFFTNTGLQKSYKHIVVIKVLINTIGKKIHTLGKENTPCLHKIIRLECGFIQKAAFFSVLLCFPPHCHANIGTGRQVRLIPPNTYQEIYDTHTCLNF